VPFFTFGNAQTRQCNDGLEQGGMSSADLTDAGSPTVNPRDALPRGRSSELRAEQRQPKPEDKKSDRSEPKDDQAGDQGPKGIKGAFKKHPVAMIVCLGLIVLGVIVGIAWYLHARHFESTDDAFIDGRPVLVSPQVTGNIITVNVTDNQIVKSGDLLATIDPRNYKAAVDQAEGQIQQNNASLKKIEPK